MKRMKKALLLGIRYWAHRWNQTQLFYWSDYQLMALYSVDVMPMFVYKGLYRVSMRLVEVRQLERVADWTIHFIPFHVRFKQS